MSILREYGVNRISLGMQTFDNDILRTINRTYTGELLEERIQQARDTGFTNINIDMMYGLPGHTIESMQSDLQRAKSLDVSHITYYPLYYYDAATLGVTGRKESNIDSIYTHYDTIVRELSEVGYIQYGREYFARPSV
jgi:oxygen-independent coproporphyrinogen III oxidase